MSAKIFSSIMFILINSSIINGCSDKTSEDSQLLIRDTLRVDLGGEAPTLDPVLSEDTVSSRLMYDLFAGLVDFDQSNRPIPGMASSWDISSDGKTYTFHLRKNLKFSDGSPITAKDFIYSWQRLVNPNTASPYSFLINDIVNAEQITKSKLDPSKLGVLATDPETLVVKLVNPNSSFLNALAMPNTAVVQQRTIEKHGATWTDPKNIVTSGAYVLKEHIVNGYMLSTKNLNFYDAKNVAIANIKYLPYFDTNVSLSNYKSASLDITFQTVPVDQYDDLKREYPSQLHTVAWEDIDYYDFNMKSPKYANNPKLRQALSMSVDREVLTKQVLKAGQTALYSYATPTIENGKYASIKYEWATWPRDKQIAEAKKLYKEAGYGPDNPLQVTINYNTNDAHKKVALAIAAMWKEILGVKATAQNQEWKIFLQARHKGDYDIARDGWVADFNSITSYTPLYKCGSDQNNAHYCNSEYDKLLNEAVLQSAGLNNIKQQQLYQRALKLAMDDYAIIPLYQGTYQKLVQPSVENYQIDGNHLDHVQSKWFKLTQDIK